MFVFSEKVKLQEELVQLQQRLQEIQQQSGVFDQVETIATDLISKASHAYQSLLDAGISEESLREWQQALLDAIGSPCKIVGQQTKETRGRKKKEVATEVTEEPKEQPPQAEPEIIPQTQPPSEPEVITEKESEEEQRSPQVEPEVIPEAIPQTEPEVITEQEFKEEQRSLEVEPKVEPKAEPEVIDPFNFGVEFEAKPEIQQSTQRQYQRKDIIRLPQSHGNKVSSVEGFTENGQIIALGYTDTFDPASLQLIAPALPEKLQPVVNEPELEEVNEEYLPFNLSPQPQPSAIAFKKWDRVVYTGTDPSIPTDEDDRIVVTDFGVEENTAEIGIVGRRQKWTVPITHLKHYVYTEKISA